MVVSNVTQHKRIVYKRLLAWSRTSSSTKTKNQLRYVISWPSLF